jgi:hypothetical protein
MRVVPLLVLASLLLTLGAASSAAAAPKVGPTFGGCLSPPTVTSTVPADMDLPDQANANCFAWQEFITLNWRADPSTCAADPSIAPAQFGEPDDPSPVVWETFEDDSQVFKPHAAAPDPWCGAQPLPAAVRDASGGDKLRPTSKHGYKALVLDSKFAADGPLFLQEFDEAFPNDAWLTAQNGHLTMYEIRLNQDEFNYIDRNTLYDAKVQTRFVLWPGINLPDGTTDFYSYGKIGAIEVKAAWLELDNPALYSSYKTSNAIVKYPGDPKPHAVVVGLVGLHIIHKTAFAQQFVWATFEHVGLDPTAAEVKSKTFSPPYVYFDPSCDPSTDHYHCALDATPTSTDPLGAPIQVARTRPISSLSGDDVAGLNQAVWRVIGESNPNSVFLNYQLVDVLWPNNSTHIAAKATIPLTMGDPRPPIQQPVANTTLETYIQDQTCLYCHVSAPISSAQSRPVLRIPKPRLQQASAPRTTSTGIYASDYSFLFSEADASPSGAGFPTWPVAGGLAGVACAEAAAFVYWRRRQFRLTSRDDRRDD